ncbi:hypothetical protein NXX91_23180 [Bacteroides thetaiotaomicron]|nr:hypothetical protein [Bacteroides thetaiotaomicron]MCS2902281.1 hypothetical protein [Bacteroides thetaiotaomicron]
MFALYVRGTLQLNNAGWCNFDDAQNVNGTNALYHDATDWLADHGWHYYTVTLTATSRQSIYGWRTEERMAGGRYRR